MTLRARNLAENPHLVVHLESGDEVVILEGVAEVAAPPARELAERLSAAFSARYGESHDYRPQPDQWDEGGLWVLRPKLALGWSTFPTTVTRWRF